MKEQRTGKWYEVKVKYHKEAGNGLQKNATETYCIGAQSFTEAEAMATEEASILTDASIVDITPAKYKEVFLDNESEKYFKIKVLLVTIDERTGKEKGSTITHLVQADTTEMAERRTKEVYNQCLMDYTITDIIKTRIADVIIPSEQ